MRAHYLQHVPFEGLGSIEPWLQNHAYVITSSPMFVQPVLPAIEEVDFLLILGGPMSVNDEAGYPWLTAEKMFIRDFIHTGKPVLGICLGAQLIANALGARVYPNAEKEIGWFPIINTATSPACFQFPTALTAFHWHGETFELPEGAERLASSTACRNQAFQVGTRAIGLQFHLETTPASAHQLMNHCRDELAPARYVQTEQQIESAHLDCYSTINTEMTRLLEYLTRTI
jgi:GMP synthase-like glutamine amidotransferase